MSMLRFHPALLAALILAIGQAAVAQEVPTGSQTHAAVVVLAGDINEFNRQNVENRFAEAREAGAQTIIFEIDSFGGLVTSGLDISRFVKRQQDLHVIAYIPDKAISAGAMIAVACDEIVMGPGAMIGNSGVVTGTGQELSGTARAKAESMVLEEFYDSAVRNGYDPLLLEAMVVVERVVHWVENEEGERRFVDGAKYDELMESGEWQPVPDVRNPIDAADTLLTLGTDLAVRVGLASESAPDAQSLAQSRGLEIVGVFAPGFGDQIVGFLHSFMFRGILMTVLMFSLYMSFSSPGQGIPEAVAVCSLGVLLGVPLLTGYATWYEIIAVLLGLTLIAVELFVLPGFGLTGITGVILILGGLTMTFVPPIPLPDVPAVMSVPWGMFQEGLLVVTGGLLASLLLWWWLARFLPKAPVFSRLILTETVGGDTATIGGGLHPAPEPTVQWPPVGARGRAITDLRLYGSAEFFDESIGDTRIVDVVSDSGFINAGTDVAVKRIQGSRVVVKKA